MVRSLFAWLYTCLVVVLIAGCSGGGGDTGASENLPPPLASSFVDIEAVPGPIVAVRVGEVVQLNDTNSYAQSSNADVAMSYEWSFSHKPAGSQAQLQNKGSSSPGFVADVAGVYMVQLVVSAEGVSSERAVTSVIVTEPPERMTGPFNHPGLSSNCVNCHNDHNATLRGKSVDHIATSNACQTCHTPQGFTIIPFADHLEVFGNCSQCHDGITAVGKSPGHAPTEAECDDCHNTTAFLELGPDGKFDHSGISRVCSSCHNGIVATGMTATVNDTPPGTHPDTSSECGYCHTTVSFLDAYPDHTGPAVVGPGITCDSCHVPDGTGSGQGQSPGHPITNVDCDVCHSVVTFTMPGGLFNHSLVDPAVQSCESCHNDNTSINAPSKSSAVPAHPATTADCGACHNTESFFPAFGFDHDGIVNDCQTCHGNNSPVPPQVTATGKPLATPFYAHMPTNPDNPGTANDQDCGDCHTLGTFSTGTYDHAGVINGCNACHDNVISVGKLDNHIPTNPDSQDCGDCHDTTSFVGAPFNHAGINTSNCALCHDGNIALGKPVSHLPTVEDCSSCHDTFNYTTFAGIAFNHFGIDTNNCASCHATGIATPKPVNHIPAQEECSACHDSVSDFRSTTFRFGLHAGITRGCEGCHNGQFSTSTASLYGKPVNHIPTTQDCDSCHTVNGFTPSSFAHEGITGNCVSCHNGQFTNVGLVGARQAPNTPIHQNTSSDCAVCHNTTSFADAFVDHASPEVLAARCDSCHNGINATGKDAKPDHVPTTQDCGVCHVAGGTFVPAVFDHTGITNNCESCHNGTNATGKHAAHLPTTQDCSLCHVTTAFINARFDHTGITDNCSSCHNGTTAPGKTPPPDHVPTNEDCHVCHVTTGFLPASFSHVGIVDNCSSCHNNVFAIGKSVSHVPTNQDCGVCHNTTSFIGAVFDHTGIVNNCASCHDGNTARGKHDTHLATSMDCHFCHTTATFVGGTWVHDSSTAGRCSDCHSPGGGATSKPGFHISTTEQCDVCHSTTSWAPDIFSHDPRGEYPGDHRRNPGCTACHGNTISSTIPWPYSRYAPFCAACHANDFSSESDHIGGRSGTVEQNKNCGQSGCHSVRQFNWD